MNKKYGVLGGGSWGTAIVKILTENNNLINWYVRNEDNVNYLIEFKKIPIIYLQLYLMLKK